MNCYKKTIDGIVPPWEIGFVFSSSHNQPMYRSVILFSISQILDHSSSFFFLGICFALSRFLKIILSLEKIKSSMMTYWGKWYVFVSRIFKLGIQNHHSSDWRDLKSLGKWLKSLEISKSVAGKKIWCSHDKNRQKKFLESWEVCIVVESKNLLDLIARHLSKGLVEFVRDGFEFLLFMDQLIFKSVHFLLQFLYWPLSKLSTSLSLL